MKIRASRRSFLGALAAPGRVDAMMRAIVQMYEQGGWLPKWPSLTYTGQMMASKLS